MKSLFTKEKVQILKWEEDKKNLKKCIASKYLNF